MQTESRIEYLGGKTSSMTPRQQQRAPQWLAPDGGTCQRPQPMQQSQQLVLLAGPKGFNQFPSSVAADSPNQLENACYQVVESSGLQQQQQSNAVLPQGYDPASQIAQQQRAPIDAPYLRPPQCNDPNVSYLQEASQNLVHKQKHLIFANSPFQHVSSDYKNQVARYVDHQRQQQARSIHTDHLACGPSACSAEMGIDRDQKHYLATGHFDQLNQVITTRQVAPNDDQRDGAASLVQVRPRVNSLSVTRREPGTHSTMCSPRQPTGLARSLSFSDQLNQRPNACGRPMQTTSLVNNSGDFCCSKGGVQEELVADGQLGQHSAQYHDIYGPRTHLAPGSLSSACSSIGSPVSIVQAVSPQLAPGHHPRPISSNSSSDGAEIYCYHPQQQFQINAGGTNCQPPQQPLTQMMQHPNGGGEGGGSSIKASSCGSSIISSSDSLSMSINLEQYISKRNERERSRVRNVNEAFDNLKNSLPLNVEKMSKRMSKVEILRTAIGYIRNLEQTLGYKQQHSSGKSRFNCNLRRLDQGLGQYNHNNNRHPHHIAKHHLGRGQRQSSDEMDCFESSPSKLLRRNGTGEHQDYEHDEHEQENKLHYCSSTLGDRDLKLSGLDEFELQRQRLVDSDQEQIDGNCSMEDDDRFEDY